MKTKINVRFCSQDIINLMESKKLAYVHSIYKSSLNLKIGDRLVHIGIDKNEISPFSICILGTEFRELVDKFDLGDKLSTSVFNFENSEIYYPTIEGREFNYDKLAKNISFTNTIIKINPSWKRGLEDPIDIEKDEFYKELLGKGPGLTPSGDDILVGFMAISRAMDKNRELVKDIKSFILNYGKERTTDVSYEYLYYATMNKFSKNIKAICESIINDNEKQVLESIYRLVKVGHTSGFDVLSGILLGTKI